MSAQVIQTGAEKRKEWSTATLNNLTLAVCSVRHDNKDGRFKSNFLKFAVEGRDHEPSFVSSESLEDLEQRE